MIAASEPLIRWDWVRDHFDDIWQRTVEHVQLTVLSVAIGFVVSALLSAIALRYRRAYGPITWVAGVLYTIPSLALIGTLVVYFGFGNTPVVIALVSYTLLILVRNIVAAFDGVPPAVREAAIGMGYTPARRVLQVELPLALPVIVAGLRIASVTVIGLVTVAALVGSGGYGAFIDDGLNRFFPTPIIVGTTLSVLLAVVVDVMFVVMERLLSPWRRGSNPLRKVATS
ncbi:MAG TPA: ABC transporter permease [Ilumatobacter sp.]|nr:ABC transporter permease [Ilumatobacter sp.]